MIVKSRHYPAPCCHVLIPFAIDPCAGSWGTVGGTMCQTNGCTMRLAKELLPAQSVIANSGYMATGLTSLRMILPTRLSLFEATLGGGDLWDDLGSLGLSRLINSVMRWAESLPGGLP